jgi:hypothetical protein
MLERLAGRGRAAAAVLEVAGRAGAGVEGRAEAVAAGGRVGATTQFLLKKELPTKKRWRRSKLMLRADSEKALTVASNTVVSPPASDSSRSAGGPRRRARAIRTDGAQAASMRGSLEVEGDVEQGGDLDDGLRSGS